MKIVNKVITDSVYVRETLKNNNLKRERKKNIESELRKLKTTEKIEELKKLKELKEKEITTKEEKEKKKEEEVMKTFKLLIKTGSLIFDPCKYLIPRAIRLGISGEKELLNIFIEGQKGNCLFYHSCKNRKNDCGKNIPKRSGNIFKD